MKFSTKISRFTPGFIALCVLATLGFAAAAGAQNPAARETATLPRNAVGMDEETALPRMLTGPDAALYRKIFRLQKSGDWQRADKKIARLSDSILMGHVLYQRYMHPTAYRSKYRELKDWMAKYADHPGAKRIYRLALRRQPKGWRSPRRPMTARAAQTRPIKATPVKRARKRLSRSRRIFARRAANRIKSLVRRERPTQAMKLLATKEYRRRLDPVSFDRIRAIIARGYFHAGKDAKAVEIAGAAARRSGAEAPYAHWWAGLAAWRLGDYAAAAGYFSDLARAPALPDWPRAAAAFWSARAYLVGRAPARVAEMLALGAGYPHTFYGLLALRARGEDAPVDWKLPRLTAQETELLNRIPTARRALALIEADQLVRAESELKRLTAAPSPALIRVLLALTGKANLPDVAIRLGFQLERTHGERYDAALFPVPGWTPNGGYNIDRALVFAFIRQESRFKANAKSRRGAAGLMQLMPATARFIARKRTARRALFEPEYNIALGQKYIRHLLEDPTIDRNLFYTASAYNAGPGNLRKWRRKIDYQDDPLLFIESIRSRETRNFVERVLTNFWTYRLRLGQATPSLAATAAGEWPIYIPLDNIN